MAQESSLKRVGDELEQEKEKKQKIDDDQEEAEMKKLIKVILDEEEVAIDAKYALAAASTKVTAVGVKVTTAGRVYTDREENKDLSKKR
ncbi:hypothetical protein Tco_0242698 [Tanacetum coccineum]